MSSVRCLFRVAIADASVYGVLHHVLPILMNKSISPTRTTCNYRIGQDDSDTVDGFLELQFEIY
jgi:hypothetical protein